MGKTDTRLKLKSMSVEELVALRDKVQTELSRKIEAERSALQKQTAALSKLEVGASRNYRRQLTLGVGAARSE